MSVTYTKTILSLVTAPVVEGYQDCVTGVTWQVSATDGTYFAQQTAATPVGPPTPEFTPFPNLTEAEVWAWIPNPQTPELEAYLAQNIADQADPPLVVLPPPWN